MGVVALLNVFEVIFIMYMYVYTYIIDYDSLCSRICYVGLWEVSNYWRTTYYGRHCTNQDRQGMVVMKLVVLF